jgi:plasmid stability protein
MRKLEILEVPDNLYDQIAEAARRKGVSISQEAADILARGITGDEAREVELLNEAREARKSMKGFFLTEADIQAAKRWDRE